jgi:hypothetical protein
VTYSSSVPAAITALVAAFTASASLGGAGVDVRDGPQLRAAGVTEGVAAGYAGPQTPVVVTGTASPEGMGTGADRERYAVLCTIEVINGSGDIAAARTRAYQLHAACGAAIGADRTLGHAVLQASPGIGNLQQQQTAGGALARIVFPVNCDAYTTR